MISSARRRAWWAAGVHLPPPGPGHNVGRAISPAAWSLRHCKVSGTMQASSPTDVGQVSGKFCRISPPQGGNAPLRLRLAAHPASGLRCPHRAACAEAHLRSATAALPRSGKDRSGERLAPAGAVSEANRAAGPALRPEIGRSYAFYRRTGDNKRSDGRLPHEKQLSPPQATLDSAAPCRGAFPNGSHPQSRQNKYSPEHGGSGLYCFVPRPRSGGPYSEITEANGRRDKPAHGGKPGAEAPHAASPNCAGGPLR